jgi:phosphate transport system permease protein
VGFQSPNVDAARPMVFATAFLLLVMVLVLNLAAILLRNRLRKKYAAVSF